jgi:hypothetical protein
MTYRSIKLVFALIVGSFILLSFPQSTLTQENTETPENSELSPPPETGTPEDASSPGGSRTDSDRIAGCRGEKKFITSLIGNEIKELTVSKYPSFWFYVPYTFDEIDNLEFVLEDSQVKRIIYQTSIRLSEVAGIIEVALPHESQYSLEQDKNYIWYLKGHCSSNSQDEPDIALSGWVRRIPLDSQLQEQLETSGSQKYEIYIQNTILYDAVTALAKQYQTNPESPQIKNAWINLLDLLGLEQLANEPFVNLTLFELSTQHRDLR